MSRSASLIEAAAAAGTALFSMTTPLPHDGSAPEWVTVFPKSGRVETRDGRAFDVSPAELMSAFKGDAIEIPVDVNHATDAAALFGGPAPAIGWGTELREHDGGLQLRVNWLAEGKSLLSARQYKYTSPSFYHEEGRATRLKALALVTAPALARQPALARAGAPVGGEVAAMAKALGLDGSATAAECLSAIGALRSGAVSKAEHDTLAAQLTTLRASNYAAAVELLLSEALKAKKIMPAERDNYAALCATPAGFDQVTQLFARKVPMLQPSGLDGRSPPGLHGGGETPAMLAGRATVYRDAQSRIGNTISQADAIAYCAAHPTAGH